MFYHGYLIVNTLEPKNLNQIMFRLQMNNAEKIEGQWVSVSTFSFGELKRTQEEQKNFVMQSLTEDLVEIHMGQRFEEQRANQGQKSEFDNIDDDGDSSSESEAQDDESSEDRDETTFQYNTAKKVAIPEQK